ncbi:MAG TPA: MFS transporter [Acidimicrobiales bacterium]|nr:MFS transporter [Acidimicrobiales bacterium]
MISRTLVRSTRLDRLPRREGVDDRAVAVAFTARLVDEVLSGAWDVLSPTFRRVFGLSLFQLGLLWQVLDWVALVVEPISASSIDHTSRRRLLAFGGAFCAASVATMAVAPSYGVLLLGFALYGVGSGPLAHTADVVVVECFPGNAERAYSRSTMLDTIGALLGPALIAAAGFADVSWRIVLVALAVMAAVHARTAARATFPEPARTRAHGESVLRALVTGVHAALRERAIRRSLAVLLAFDAFEVAFVLEYVWLHDDVGLSEPQVALWAAAFYAVDLIALLVLDRWLEDREPRRILRAASAALIVLPALWVAAPGIGGKILVGIPLTFVSTFVWPLAKARSLTAVPDLAGSTQAITTLFAILPLTLAETWLATAIGIGPAMAITAGAAAALMVALLRPDDVS